MVEKGKVRINGRPVRKPGAAVHIGDVLTFVQARSVRVVIVEGFALRRGPATEAQLLYRDSEVGD